MAECESCGAHADAQAYYTDPAEVVDYCRDCALRKQMEGSPPAAVAWTGDVEVDVDP